MQKRGMIFAAALLALLLAAVLAPAALAEVEINDTTFPDATFRAYVKEKFDKNDDNILSDDEIAAVEGIHSHGRGIADLTGVEYFTALKFLDCGINALTELDVSANTALEVLYCNANQLTALDVSANTALKVLYCDANQLTALNVSDCTALYYLDCPSNQLTALNVSGLHGAAVPVLREQPVDGADLSQNNGVAVPGLRRTKPRSWGVPRGCGRNMDGGPFKADQRWGKRYERPNDYAGGNCKRHAPSPGEMKRCTRSLLMRITQAVTIGRCR